MAQINTTTSATQTGPISLPAANLPATGPSSTSSVLPGADLSQLSAAGTAIAEAANAPPHPSPIPAEPPITDPVQATSFASKFQARVNTLQGIQPDQEAVYGTLTPAQQEKFKELSSTDRQHFMALYQATQDNGGLEGLSQFDEHFQAGYSLMSLLQNGTLAKPGVLDNLARLQQGPPWSGYGQAGVAVNNNDQLCRLIDGLSNPKHIFQGYNSEFCAAASVMSRLALSDPAAYTRMAADLVTRGQTTLPDGSKLAVSPKAVASADQADGQNHEDRDAFDSLMMSTLYRSVGNAGDGQQMLTPAQYTGLYGKFFPGTLTVGPHAVDEATVLAAARKGPVSLMFYNKKLDSNGQPTNVPLKTESHTVTVRVTPDGQIQMFTNGKEKIWHRGGGDAADFDKLFANYFAGANLPAGLVTAYQKKHGLSSVDETRDEVQTGKGSSNFFGSAWHTMTHLGGDVVHSAEKLARHLPLIGGWFGSSSTDDTPTGGRGTNSQTSTGGRGVNSQTSTGGRGGNSQTSTGGRGVNSQTSTGGRGVNSQTSTGGRGVNSQTSTGGDGQGVVSTG